MLQSLSENTIKQYGTSYKMWWKYCQTKGISPFDCRISDAMSFFQSILDSYENKFGSFNAYRAALSLISSQNLGENNEIKRFIKGVFRLRPPRPKYNVTWNPHQVLIFLRNSNISKIFF